MTKKPKTALRKAVDWLIEEGKIKNDSDLTKALGISSKGTISGYLSGASRPSRNFTENFEKVFSINLADFESDGKAEQASPGTVALKDKYIELLERQLETERQLRKTEFASHGLSSEVNLAAILEEVRRCRAEVRAGLLYLAASQAGGDQQKEDDILLKLNNLIADSLLEGKTSDSRLAWSR